MEKTLYHGGFGQVGVKCTGKNLCIYTIGPAPQKIMLPVDIVALLAGQLQTATQTIKSKHPQTVLCKDQSLDEIVNEKNT